MKSLVLHIGIPKTGSSALQVFCAQNRRALVAQSLDYFELGEFGLGSQGKISAGNGAYLARSFLRPQGPAYRTDRDEQLIALERAITASKCETGLLSSELFVFADDLALAGFRRWLADRGVELRFLYFIREQIEFLASSYIQQVKRHGCTETAEEYVLRVYPKIGHIKYAKLFERLAKCAHPEGIICRNYDDARTLQHGVCDAFVTALGLDPAPLAFGKANVNVSLDLIELKIMLALNRFEPRMRFSDFMVENAARRGRKGSDLSPQLVSREVEEEIENYFAADNTAFARSYFGREKLFPARDPVADAVRERSSREPAVSDVIEVLGGLLVRFDERLAALERKVKNAISAEGVDR